MIQAINLIIILSITLEVLYLFTCGSIVMRKHYRKQDYAIAKMVYLLIVISIFSHFILCAEDEPFSVLLTACIGLLTTRDYLRVYAIKSRLR